MKKLLVAVFAMAGVFGLALSQVKASEAVTTTAAQTSGYTLTAADNAIIAKFVQKIDEKVAEKGEAFKTGIIALIKKLAEHEKATERVKAVFLKLADVVENGEDINQTTTTGTVTTGTTTTGTVTTGAIATTGTVETTTGAQQ